ncbi:LuxR C-terminal-related transcriptional regulator, partial [Streptomyces sp. NPDC127079]|uniref:helix-turn-helix transcriptional regulator n=1 Tax=Streptomyces sp. NPDC127079 TaxID=3347132 RepID=UPI00364F5605
LACLMARARERGALVLDGRCYPTERDAFCVFTRALSDLVTPERLARLSPAHADLVRAGLCARRGRTDPAPRPLPLSQAVRALLTDAAGEGLLLVLDDFHWADPRSLEFADHLVRWSLRAPVLIVIAHRPRQTDPLLLSTLAYGAEQGRVTRVALSPLRLEQAARLLDVRPDTDWLPPVHRESEGNILSLLVLGESAPLRPYLSADLVAGRLAPLSAELELLSPSERLVAESGAVLGNRFTREELTAVCELPFPEVCAAVAELIRHDIMRPLPLSAARFTFRQPMVRDLLNDRADRYWQQQAHRRALALLNRRAAPATERAAHIELATSSFTPQDLQTLAQAGEEAVLSAPEDAVRWLSLALRGLPSDDGSTDRLLALIPPLTRALQSTDYLHDGEALRHLIGEDAGTRPDEARYAAIRLCVLAESLQGRFTDADALLRAELVRLGSDTADRDRLARLTVLRGITACLRDDAELPAVASTALLLARSGGRPATLAAALSLHALAELTAGRTTQSLAAYYAAVRQMDALPDAELRPHTEYVSLLGWCASSLGRPREAESFYDRGVAVSARRSPDVLLPALLSGRAEARLRQGRLSEARRSAAEAGRLAGHLGADQLRAYAAAQEALCATYAEPPGSSHASARTEEALRALHPAAGAWHSVAVLTVAESLLLQGSPERCTDLLLDLAAPDLGTLTLPLRARACELLALAALACGTPVSPWADRAAQVLRACPLPQIRAHALMARGHESVQQDDPAAAIAAYQEAERLVEGRELRLQRLCAAVGSARAAGSGGRSEEAAKLWAIARELARQLHVLRFAGPPSDASPSHDTPPGPAPTPPELATLTRRELEVARLVGTGRRTREVAGALKVSPRTIEVHLSRIYRKLGIGSRAELARLMAVRAFTDARA